MSRHFDDWALQKFFQDCGAVLNAIHPAPIRMWGARYMIYLRDREIVKISCEPPKIDEGFGIDCADAEYVVKERSLLIEKLEAIAERHFHETSKT